METQNSYSCQELGESGVVWEKIERIALSDVVSGGVPQALTYVQMHWNAEGLYIRFTSQDDYVVSDFTQHDEPLYEQDVVEVFIDEEGDGKEYLELEVSPHNIVFDAYITNDLKGKIEARTEWHFDGLVNSVRTQEGGWTLYDIHIPMRNFKRPIAAGMKWRVNFYRIDDKPDGVREFSAWQPTGKVNFHMPGKFGWLVFV
ncbi:carbohydrate-binding family 9-like protein [Paenibacillus sepulcri]|uniref:Carbohydrate-binding family 9-like protein n=1 Tax=Paenibacillus sepulcri TaxID=359917 RepID=A0ABS7C546_9BACL|nr:carbohydrate-binding family 9-like protein [Paenibacillus sepulcri]